MSQLAAQLWLGWLAVELASPQFAALGARKLDRQPPICNQNRQHVLSVLIAPHSMVEQLRSRIMEAAWPRAVGLDF